MAQLQTEIEDFTNEAKSAEEKAKKAMTDVRMLLWFSLWIFKASSSIAAGS